MLKNIIMWLVVVTLCVFIYTMCLQIYDHYADANQPKIEYPSNFNPFK